MSEENSNKISRRNFIRKSVETVGVVSIGNELISQAEAAPVRTASDWVQLGHKNKNNIKIPRLGIGTGSINGQVQRSLGQEGFTKLIGYAYDRGVRYFDTADNYKTHEMVREAIKANKIPRDKIFIQTKLPIREETTKDPMATIDRYRKELGTDYFDSLLIHCATRETWVEDLKFLMEAFDKAQDKGIIKIKGCSCHGLRALRAATKNNWVEVQLARINPQGHYVDQNLDDVHDPNGNYPEAMKEIKAMHAEGRGIIAMKLCGNGDFVKPEDREKAVQHAVKCGFVDAMVVGFKSNAEIDEAIERVNRALS
ncbi:MAG: aldo/keto reductase [Blastocatellia bacterium]|nr:aldo/keto reductase [Blastocatellia bacterium]